MYRGRGIGRAVVSFLAARTKRNGISELLVQEVYSWNICSKHCFESVGFVPCKPTEKGVSYRLKLRQFEPKALLPEQDYAETR